MRLRRAWQILLLLSIAFAALPLAYWGEWMRVDEARRECRKNLKTLASILRDFHEDEGAFPRGTIHREDAEPEHRLSWLVKIADRLDTDSKQRTSGVLGRELLPPDAPRPVLACPANPRRIDAEGRGVTHYVGVGGLGTDAPTLSIEHVRVGVFGFDRTTRMADIRDGPSTTMMVIETTEAHGPWYKGGVTTVRGLDPARKPYVGTGRPFGGTHEGGVMVIFADGSVRFLRKSIDSRVFEAASTIAGGEPARVDREFRD
jgi:prepilin-type processing-associated H-X9-DG protein